MASIKELHFFDDESHDWGVPDYSKVDAYFPAADQRLRGEATPVTLYWRPATRRLRQYNSEIKLILLLRNPVERAYSNWRMEYTNGRETQLFSDAIRQGRDRVRSEAEVEGLHRYFSYVERGFYGRQLANLLELFPKRQIHCELSEEFFDDPSTTLQRLSTFLAIPPFPVIPPLHENPGRLAGYPSPLSKDDRAYLSALFADDIAAVEAFLGRSISRWKNLESVQVIGSPR